MATLLYLMTILNNNFQDRKVIYLTDEGEQEYIEYTVTASVPHSSVLEPLGFADDIDIASIANTARVKRRKRAQ